MEPFIEKTPQIEYPHENVMDLFLKIGEKTNIFDTISMKNTSGETVDRYKSINGVNCLKALSDYLGLPQNKKEKEVFLNQIETGKKEDILCIIAKKILEIWGQKNPNNFETGMIKIYEENLLDKKDMQIRDLPIITDNVIPKRGAIGKGGDVLIHKMFQEKLDADKKIKDQADIIQKNTESHTFSKSVDTEKIDILKRQL